MSKHITNEDFLKYFSVATEPMDFSRCGGPLYIAEQGDVEKFVKVVEEVTESNDTGRRAAALKKHVKEIMQNHPDISDIEMFAHRWGEVEVIFRYNDKV